VAFRVPGDRLTASIPTDIPDVLTAGDTWQWTRSYVDYLAGDGWSLNYFIRGPASLDVTADADGDTFAITVSASDTESLPPGTYQYLARVSKDGEVFTVGSGSTVVQRNLETAVDDDLRSFAEQMVEALEASLLADAASVASGGSGGVVLSYTIGTRSVTFKDEDAVRKALSHYKWQVYLEQHPGQIGVRRPVRFV
jgi:hypothetical protein